MKIYVCTGHANYGDRISSADGTSKGGCNEYLYNAKLLPFIKKWCDVAGVDCDIDTPKEGALHSLNDEINYYCGNANRKKYDLVIQLHLNAFDGTANGTEVWIYKGNEKAKEYAKRITENLGTRWKKRGVKESTSLYWLKRTVPTALLIESFFCDNATDYNTAKQLTLDEHAKLIVEAIVNKKLKEDKKNGCKCNCKCCK